MFIIAFKLADYDAADAVWKLECCIFVYTLGYFKLLYYFTELCFSFATVLRQILEQQANVWVSWYHFLKLIAIVFCCLYLLLSLWSGFCLLFGETMNTLTNEDFDNYYFRESDVQSHYLFQLLKHKCTSWSLESCSKVSCYKKSLLVHLLVGSLKMGCNFENKPLIYLSV